MKSTLIREIKKEIHPTNESKSQASFLRSQIMLFNSRRKHGLLYSFATAAGLFCIPGILGVMATETEINMLFQKTIPLPFITLMIAVGMYVLNDLVDADIDRVNSKNRPIPSGLVSKRQAWTFIILTNGLAVGMSLVTFNLITCILLVPMIIIGILYSLPKQVALMNRFLLKNISIALFYMLCAMLGFTSSYSIDLVIKNPIIAIHTIAMSGIMIFVGSTVNDLGDIKGDKGAGRHTIPIVLGGLKTVKMLIILLAAMAALSWLLYASFDKIYSVGNMVTPIAVSVVAALAILRMSKIQRVFEDMKLMRVQHKKWFPLYMVLQSAMAMGSFLY
ncbi:MAG: UbiA prenyltransferase family protein [Nitrososphaera sp.]